MPIEIESPEELGYDKIRYNLAESSVAEQSLGQLDLDLNHLKLEYTAHRGHEGLRELIAVEGDGLDKDDVLLTGGAALALYIVHTSLLSTGDPVLIAFPNYSSNLAVPKAIGCEIISLKLEFKNQWKLNVDELKNQITPQTKLISLTYPHNPTGQILTMDMIHKLVELSDEFDIPILMDETYRDACFQTTYPLFASFHSRFISVISFSKGYGLPGIRIGALITKDIKLREIFLAAKEMIQICNPPLEEAIAYAVYQKKSTFLETINQQNQYKLEILKDWLTHEPRVEAVWPKGGVVCFVRINSLIDFSKFHQILLAEFGTLVGPGHWFDMPAEYMRIGFGYPVAEDLKSGLSAISKTMNILEQG